MLNYRMVLIKSISGVRGVIHKNDLEGLSSAEIIKCIQQFASWIILKNQKQKSAIQIAVGRDGRISGERISTLVIETLVQFGLDVIDLGLTTTPSVQLSIATENCLGGIMISASHNPANWNGLKFLNLNGEFLSKKEGLEVFSSTDILNNSNIEDGTVQIIDYKSKHVESILGLKDVDVKKIKNRKLKVVVDGINSSGGIYVPFLLEKLGVEVIKLNCNPNGMFAHNPEPLEENLNGLSVAVQEHQADLGIAVDPDVDRLVLVCEDGSFFGEEYTIVSIGKYILTNNPHSSIVSNLSTTRAVYDIANELGVNHFESAVGEINVVELMKEKQSLIGGEGSGGVIFAPSHYGRDALVGIALFLSYFQVFKYYGLFARPHTIWLTIANSTPILLAFFGFFL